MLQGVQRQLPHTGPGEDRIASHRHAIAVCNAVSPFPLAGGGEDGGENPQFTPHLDPPRGEELMSPANVHANENRCR
jgi:hypothetical protein